MLFPSWDASAVILALATSGRQSSIRTNGPTGRDGSGLIRGRNCLRVAPVAATAGQRRKPFGGRWPLSMRQRSGGLTSREVASSVPRGHAGSAAQTTISAVSRVRRAPAGLRSLTLAVLRSNTISVSKKGTQMNHLVPALRGKKLGAKLELLASFSVLSLWRA